MRHLRCSMVIVLLLSSGAKADKFCFASAETYYEQVYCQLEAKAQVTQNLSLIGGYSYMESEVLRGSLFDGSSLKGNEFATAPKHSASLWSYYDVPATDVSVGLGARYVGAYYFDAANSGKSDGTTLFDAAFNYKIAKGTDLALNVSNLLDEQHVVGSGTANFYNPGREITAKLSYNW